jgi:hypothetical protein
MNVTVIYSQISPGDLTTSHANLEGISNCTMCHDIGEKVSNIKCLECHKEIQSLLNQNNGYHSSSSVVNKDCFECHSDHHGRKFDMVRFDENNFNHNLTGYVLEGQHKVVDCKECHSPNFISNRDIKKRENTFLGLDQKCLSCHTDFHQKTLSSDCIACHNMDSFKPVLNFDHDNTDYSLIGKHLSVDCIECHKITTRNGERFQEFGELSFTNCKSCHKDPHNNQIQGKCMQCHNETSFSNFIGESRFNHNSTGFKIIGQHNNVACFSCHDRTSNPLSVFQDKINISQNNCVKCHNDVHEGKYELDCAKCHNERSFLSLNNMDFFDHTITDYPLEGKHVEVDCKKCHKKRFSTAIDFMACSNCHNDYHNEEFTDNSLTPDCVECHSLENGFDYTFYTLEEHQSTSFQLEGAHLATPCFACHISEDDERWTFANLGSVCVDCHVDIHEEFISSSYYPNSNCVTCHVNDAWDLVSFDHNLTDWPLEGKHIEVNCKECHFKISDNETVVSQNFINLDTQCASCHENIHDDSFAVDGITDCNRCHVTDGWFPKKFDHNSADFRLEGRHTEISCSACHEVENDRGESIVIYDLNKFKCTDCHQ